MRIGQNPAATSTQSTAQGTAAQKTAAPTTTPAAPARAGAERFATGFDGPARINTFTQTTFVTPAPPPDTGTAPGGTVSKADQHKALDEAHQLVFGNKANGPTLNSWLQDAEKMATAGKSFEEIKYALFDKLRGVASAEQMAKPDATLQAKALDEAHGLVFGKPAEGAKRDELLKDAAAMAKEGKSFDEIKYALFDKMRGVPSAEKLAHPDAALQRKALDEAHQLVFGNKANGTNLDSWIKEADKLAKEGKSFDEIKFALFDKLRGVPSADQLAKPDATLRRKALDEAHQLVFGAQPSGPHLQAWMDLADKLGKEGKSFDEIKYALFDKLRAVK